jgi:hypothetical protein
MTPEVVLAKRSSFVVAQADNKKHAVRTSMTFFMAVPPVAWKEILSS